MRPKQHETSGSGDLFRAQLDQIINLKHELAQLSCARGWGGSCAISAARSKASPNF